MALTLFRIAAGPVVAALVLWAESHAFADRPLAALIYLGASALFILAALSDWLDGHLARKLNVVSPLGAALDHGADKVLAVCVLLALAYAAMPLNLVIASILLLGRDVAVASLREGLSASGRAPPVGRLGKWKAALTMAGIAALLLLKGAALAGAPDAMFLTLFHGAHALLWAAVGLALWSGARYATAAFAASAR
jgi:CDP-diacylglycerol--glycerol-3-phosphate 3-phosphatidyltransferase